MEAYSTNYFLLNRSTHVVGKLNPSLLVWKLRMFYMKSFLDPYRGLDGNLASYLNYTKLILILDLLFAVTN